MTAGSWPAVETVRFGLTHYEYARQIDQELDALDRLEAVLETAAKFEQPFPTDDDRQALQDALARARKAT